MCSRVYVVRDKYGAKIKPSAISGFRSHASAIFSRVHISLDAQGKKIPKIGFLEFLICYSPLNIALGAK